MRMVKDTDYHPDIYMWMLRTFDREWLCAQGDIRQGISPATGSMDDPYAHMSDGTARAMRAARELKLWEPPDAH